jgi:hypothetical protein
MLAGTCGRRRTPCFQSRSGATGRVSIRRLDTVLQMGGVYEQEHRSHSWCELGMSAECGSLLEERRALLGGVFSAVVAAYDIAPGHRSLSLSVLVENILVQW